MSPRPLRNAAGETLESVFQTRVEQLARFYGWTAYHTHDSRRSAAGFPDLAMYRRAGARGESYRHPDFLTVAEPACELLFAELKVGRRALTPEQQGWLAALQGASVEAHEWRWPAAVPHICERLAHGRVRIDPEWALPYTAAVTE